MITVSLDNSVSTAALDPLLRWRLRDGAGKGDGMEHWHGGDPAFLWFQVLLCGA